MRDAPTNPARPPRPDEARLARLIGVDAAFRLIELHGGTRLPVPKYAHQGTKTAREIGLHAARALSAEYGGLVIKVPLARQWRAVQLRRNGKSYAEIARALCATESSVWSWLRAAGETEGDAATASRTTGKGTTEEC